MTTSSAFLISSFTFTLGGNVHIAGSFVKEEDVKSRLHETAYLNPELTLHYENKRHGEEEKCDFHEPEGILAYVRELNTLKNSVEDYENLKSEFDDVYAYLEMGYETNDASIIPDVQEALQIFTSHYETLHLKTSLGSSA